MTNESPRDEHITEYVTERFTEHVSANPVVVETAGEYATIEMTAQNDTIEELRGPGARRAVARVLAEPQAAIPPVLMAMSAVLFADGHHETAAFWFYAGQLRARFDANRCTDPTAAAACGALTEAFGHPINRYAFRTPGVLPGLIERVVAWDAVTGHDYDQRWIALHGMGAFGFSDGGPLSTPAPGWDALAERTRQTFLSDVHDLFDDDGRLRTELFE